MKKRILRGLVYAIAFILMLTFGSFANGEVSEGNWSYEYNGSGILTLNGDGVIPDQNPDDLPWKSDLESVKKVIVGKGITGIGANVFANLPANTRVDFEQDVQPAISETAFAGTSDVVCRYFIDNEWTAGDYGGTDICW